MVLLPCCMPKQREASDARRKGFWRDNEWDMYGLWCLEVWLNVPPYLAR